MHRLKIIIAALFALSLALIQGCKVTYSFSGINIQSDVQSITVSYFENRDPMSPSLANNLTNELIDKYRKLTKLDILPEDGHLEVSGVITGYKETSGSVTAGEFSALNRLTITIEITYTNKLHPEDSFDRQSFSEYEDYDSAMNLESVRGELEEKMVARLAEAVFNGTVAQWK